MKVFSGGKIDKAKTWSGGFLYHLDV